MNDLCEYKPESASEWTTREDCLGLFAGITSESASKSLLALAGL